MPEVGAAEEPAGLNLLFPCESRGPESLAIRSETLGSCFRRRTGFYAAFAAFGSGLENSISWSIPPKRSAIRSRV